MTDTLINLDTSLLIEQAKANFKKMEKTNTFSLGNLQKIMKPIHDFYLSQLIEIRADMYNRLKTFFESVIESSPSEFKERVQGCSFGKSGENHSSEQCEGEIFVFMQKLYCRVFEIEYKEPLNLNIYNY